jgi:hypothetical protein
MPPRRERVHMIAMLTATRLRPRSQYCQARYTACSPSISHTHPTLSRLVYLHVRCRVCLPAGHIYLPVRRFLHHLTLHPTLQPAQDPPTAAVPILYSHCRSCPLKLLHFRPAIAYRHSASPLGTTHVVLDGRTTQCPPHTNYLTTARSHAEIVSSSLARNCLFSRQIATHTIAHHSATTASLAYPVSQSGSLTRPLSGAIISTLCHDQQDAFSSLLSRPASSLTSLTSLRALTLRNSPTTFASRHALQTWQWLSPRKYPLSEASFTPSLPSGQLPFDPQQHAVNS